MNQIRSFIFEVDYPNDQKYQQIIIADFYARETNGLSNSYLQSFTHGSKDPKIETVLPLSY